jgi:hypothetical protein
METHSIVILVQVVGDHRLVPRKCLLEVSERIAGYTESRSLDIMGKFIESGARISQSQTLLCSKTTD